MRSVYFNMLGELTSCYRCERSFTFGFLHVLSLIKPVPSPNTQLTIMWELHFWDLAPVGFCVLQLRYILPFAVLHRQIMFHFQRLPLRMEMNRHLIMTKTHQVKVLVSVTQTVFLSVRVFH